MVLTSMSFPSVFLKQFSTFLLLPLHFLFSQCDLAHHKLPHTKPLMPLALQLNTHASGPQI